MNQPLHYTRREVVELMMSNGFHGNVDRFMAILAEAQQRALSRAHVDNGIVDYTEAK